ncbi:MAG: flagellar basal body rod protein FlgC [Clostridiales bacterium]|jgi:flagellar basal-body rod protein FlgC|nr:flagellar basal body rod protein FlgC [Clostridiales bacterium]
MAFCSSLDIVGSALTAERFRTDIIIQNISNANTTVTSSGEPYRRQQVVFEEIPVSFSDELNKASGKSKAKGGVKVAQVVESDRDFVPVYDPTNPQADEQGYVLYPNVDKTEEMIDLMAASNAYEANLTALSVIKAMINKTLELGK